MTVTELANNLRNQLPTILDEIIDNLKGMVYCNIYDSSWTMVFVSKGSVSLTGYTPDDLINNKIVSFEDITYEEDRVHVRNVIKKSVKNRTNYEIEYRVRHKNGSLVWVIEYGSPIYNQENKVIALQGYIDDISARKKSEVHLQEAERKYRSLIENSIDGIFQTSANGEYLLANTSLANIYGYDSIDELKLHVHNVRSQLYISPKRRDEFIHEVESKGYATNFESQIRRKDKRIIWISESARKVCDDSGKFLYYEGMVRDITELKVAQDTIESSEKATKRALDELNYQKHALDKHAIVAMTDARGTITYVNDKFCTISGYSQEELIGQDHKIVNSGYHPQGFFKEMYRTIAKGDTWSNEICNRSKNGTLYWVQTTVVPFIGENGKPTRYIAVRTDITSRKAVEKNNSYLAFYDSLTNLPNRRLLTDRLHQAILASSRNGNVGAVLFLDLDHFKTLNDSLGHDIGDLLLQQFAKCLLSSVRATDTVARLGGDEFVVLLEALSTSELEAAAKVETVSEKILDTICQPFQLADHEYQITTSIGVAFFLDTDQSSENVLKNADIAMYQAKKSGRNLVRFFDPQMQINIRERLNLERELRSALSKEEFHLQYQPQVDQYGRVLGAEALIRWIHPARGVVSPFHFIPLAEDTGLILPIGEWVVETACAQLKKWQEDPATWHLTLSINVSARQFRQPQFVSQITSCISKFNINPGKLKLELTESMLVENLDETITTMTILKGLGVRFSLDDFGTGYSSLQYLKLLPLDQLKIDQSFVRDLTTDPNDEAIVRTIIAMAHALNLEVIAEGVETKEQRQLLINNGCGHFQGYLFARPLPIEDMTKLLSTNSKTSFQIN